jgi:hypothetical protein
MRKTKSSSITTQVILPTETKEKKTHLSECILSENVVTTITRSEEIKKKEITQQAKKKRTVLKRNKRINDEHDKYLKQQEKKKKEMKNEHNRNETNEMKAMLELNQSKKFQEFDDDESDQKMMKYSKKEPMIVSKKQTLKAKEQSNMKIKIVKKQMKELVTLKKLKILDSIRVMRNRSRFNVQKMMNLMMSLLIKQLLNESQQLRKEFV